MPSRRTHSTHKQRRIGVGSIVRIRKPFGLGKPSVGTKGVVTGEFHRGQPTVRFEGASGEYVPPADSIEVVSGTSKKPYINILTIEQAKAKAQELGYRVYEQSNPKRFYAGKTISVFDNAGYEDSVTVDVWGDIEDGIVKINRVVVPKGQLPRRRSYQLEDVEDQEGTDWSE